jgi:hypothetical protein
MAFITKNIDATCQIGWDPDENGVTVTLMSNFTTYGCSWGVFKLQE